MFDSHSRDSSGNPAIDGTAILLKFNWLLYIDKYIRKMYLKKQAIPAYLQIQFTWVVCSMEDISNIQADLKREKQKWKYKENSVLEKMQAKTKYHENSLTILSTKRKRYAGNSRSNWVNKFQKQILEGPFFYLYSLS